MDRFRAPIAPIVICLFVLSFSLQSAGQQERWNELNAQVERLYGLGKYAEAVPLEQEAISLAEKALGPEHPDVAELLGNLAEVYRQLGNYADGEPLFQRALRIREKALGPEHPDVAELLNNLASLYVGQGNYAGAEPLFQRALHIREKALGPDHPDVAISLVNLAFLHNARRDYAGAEPLLRRALRIQEKALGPDHPDVGDSLNNLAFMYYAQGDYVSAEPLFQRALRIREKALGPDHPNVANLLNNLAGIYYQQGDYTEAEPLFQRALRIQEKALGPDHPDLAATLSNLADCYLRQGNYAEVEPLFQRALRIQEKALGPDHPDLAYSLTNLAQLYLTQENYASAEPLLLRSLHIREKTLGTEHPSVAISLNDMALLYLAQGSYASAESLLQRALHIQEKTLGPEHPDAATVLFNLGVLFSKQQMPDRAQPYFDRSLANLFRRFQHYFTYMSEKERLAFLSSSAYEFPGYYSFVLQFHEQDLELAGRMYDLMLWQKGLVVGSMATLRRQIGASGDAEALRLLEQLVAKRNEMARLLGAQPADREQWHKRIEQGESEANALERMLATRSGSFAQQKKLENVTWQQVRNTLQPDEAAVEFVRFRFYDGKKLTDANYYVALVLTAETKIAPAFVVLGEASKLESSPMEDYRSRIGQLPKKPEPSASTFYDAFWKPLKPALGNARRVYVAPDGVLNQISLGIVLTPENRLLLEEYDLRMVGSTKDILRQPLRAKSNSAVLFGDPDFDLPEDQKRVVLKKMLERVAEQQPVLASQTTVASGAGMRSRDFSRTVLARLPNFAAEVKEVGGFLSNRKWQVTTYAGSEALEELIKQVQHPRVLHIVTHGFFLPDQKIKNTETPFVKNRSGLEDPMLRSGLYFVGANRTLAGKPSSEDLDDGVFTAYEASGLDLQGTELVVLSACDTGLGDTQNGEGVFGLRRALQVAGAESVLMSLWKVPDQETRELMAFFYQKWLGGKDKHQALREAQMEERTITQQRYHKDLPEKWGAFVLVGR